MFIVCVGCWWWGTQLLSTRHHSCQGNAALWLSASRRSTTWCCSPLPDLRLSFLQLCLSSYLFRLFFSKYFWCPEEHTTTTTTTTAQNSLIEWQNELTYCLENIANKTVITHKVLTSPWQMKLKSGEKYFCLKYIWMHLQVVLSLQSECSTVVLIFRLFYCVISFLR